jgi:hypothetical protein
MELTTEQRDGELGLVGKGVAPVRIEEIDKLVATYLRRKEASALADAAESEAKSKLIDAMHEHADQLEQPDGDLVYKFNQTIVSLIAGAEKLKVEVKEAAQGV